MAYDFPLRRLAATGTDQQSMSAEIAVAIPVRNEAAHIAACLTALDRQSMAVPVTALVFLNNCTDHSAAVIDAIVPALRIQVRVVRDTLPEGSNHAGMARRRAMDLAAELVQPGGWLLSTDADARVEPDWLLGTATAFAAGAAAVAGRACIDPMDQGKLAPRLLEDDAAERRYSALLDRITSLLDPDPFDPWPRHDEHSGASIAVTAAAYREAGGIPVVPVGEDRAFFAALRRIDAPIRHANDVAVTVSGRTVGRAAGGMADTIRRRLAAPDPWLDDRLEPVDLAVARAKLRARARTLFAAGRLAEVARAWTPPPPADVIAFIEQARHFGAAWETTEAWCPTLRRRRVLSADLPRATRAAEAVLARLLLPGVLPHA